jgi:hypothetical protein
MLATVDHYVLGAAGDPEKTIFVETAKVTGIDPIAIYERALVVDLVDVEYSRSCHDHDTDFVDCAVALEPIVVVELDDTNTSIRHRLTDRAEADGTTWIGDGSKSVAAYDKMTLANIAATACQRR